MVGKQQPACTLPSNCMWHSLMLDSAYNMLLLLVLSIFCHCHCCHRVLASHLLWR